MIESTHDSDRHDLADTVVNMLIDADYSPDDIKDEFRGDKLIATALKDLNDNIDPEAEYEDYEEDESEYDDDNYNEDYED
jgi:hypothetical protein